eukprot:scaffold184725_cov19-Tisochrysis_lutea.AAC.1
MSNRELLLVFNSWYYKDPIRTGPWVKLDPLRNAIPACKLYPSTIVFSPPQKKLTAPWRRFLLH